MPVSIPRLLDLFCGAGGAAMGYHRAGFDVVGVDINPQPHFPFKFIQADAMTFSLDGFDVIHASPPCQAYSRIAKSHPERDGTYVDLVAKTRERLRDSGTVYVIENVVGAPLLNPIRLCGAMFGRALYRHRLFESSVGLVEPGHLRHEIPASSAGHWRPGTIISIAGHFSPVALGREVMDIDWMMQSELAQAIPPAFTEWVGKQLMVALNA